MSADKLIRVARCIYRVSGTKIFKHSVRLPGKKFPTKRKLAATTQTAALKEVETLNTRRREARLGLGLDPYAAAQSVGALAAQWSDRACPNRKGQARTGAQLAAELAALGRALKWWRHRNVNELRRKHCGEYRDWRVRQSRKFRLTRSVDRELLTLSNLFEWAVDEDLIRQNPILGRQHFHRAEHVRHCTAVMPTSDEDFHRLASYLLDRDQSRTLGWQFLIEGLTGNRTSEVLALRLDARELPGGDAEPGWFNHHQLVVKRCKDGVNPVALMECAPGHSPLRDCLNAFLNWHARRYPHSPWFFPGRDPRQAMDRCSLTHALERAGRALGLKKVTSHGQRAYFVAGLRAMNIPDAEIAARLGHRSTQQVEQTYGTVKSGFRGSWQMDFLPEDFAPAWAPWLPEKSYQKLIVPKAAEPRATKLAAVGDRRKTRAEVEES